MISDFLSVLRQSWHTFHGSLKHIIVMSLVLGAVYTLGVHAISRSLEYDAENIVRSFGIDEERFAELSVRMEEGDEKAMQEMMREVKAVQDRYEHMTEAEREAYVEEQVLQAFEKLAPRFFLFGIIVFLLFVAGITYSLLTYSERHTRAIDIFRHSAVLFLPMTALLLWVCARSFVWVGLFGFLPRLEWVLPYGSVLAGIAAIITGPSLLLSPVFFVRQGEGVRRAVSSSLRYSKGHWVPITVHTVLIALCVYAVQMLAGTILSVAEPYVGSVTVYASGVLQQLSIAFLAAFLLQLSSRFSD